MNSERLGQYACIINTVGLGYPPAPFDPSEAYPELIQLGYIVKGQENAVYAAFRSCLIELGYDKEKYGTSFWNPLSRLIKPGDRVLIKPNFVLHFNGDSDDISAVVTHASVLRPLVDYVWKALEGRGEILIGDAPHGNADFSEIIRKNGAAQLVEFLRSNGVRVKLVDFRKYVYPSGPSGFEKGIYREQSGDPMGYVAVDLQDKSFLNTLNNIPLLYGSDYNRKFIVSNHENGHHRYLIAASVLNADVIISVPKMKVHKKTGVTLNIKNLVGINGDKNYLAHYRVGSPKQGGDEYPDIAHPYWRLRFAIDRKLCDVLMAPNKTVLRKVYRVTTSFLLLLDRLLRRMVGRPRKYRNGDWAGNDTTWRMALDLYWILLYANVSGMLQDVPQRKVFSVIDGVVAGEGDGPMEPDAKNVGAVICSEDPVLADAVTGHMMGFDVKRLKIITESLKSFRGQEWDRIPADQVTVKVDGEYKDFREMNLRFLPHPEWTEMMRW